MDTFIGDAMPAVISGPVGIGKESLYDLLHDAYGDQADSITSVRVGYWDATQLASIKGADGKSNPFSYWAPSHPTITKVVMHNAIGADQDLGASHGSFTPATVDASQFKNVFVEIGNNIMPNVAVQVAESTANGSTVWHDLNVSVIPHELTTHGPSDHAPSAADIVSTARFFANVERGVANTNDCHFIAMDIAASAGAVFDPNTQSTNPVENEEGGFWRIAYRGSDAGAVDDWQSKVQPGDIVRMGWKDGGFHTVTVTSGLNAKGEIQVVDNGGNVIQEHWVDYDNGTNKGSVTIYRLTTDDKYLIDESKDGHGNTILGTHFNDLIKGGDGADTLRGGAGNDELHGGNGNDTLSGGAGNDTLDGGAGADAMSGGTGNDTYYVDNVGDSVNEQTIWRLSPVTHLPIWRDSHGIDEIRTTLNEYSIDNTENTHIRGNIENLTFVGAGNFTGRGNALDNVITGGNGDDKLFGGDGADTLRGGNGNDRLDGGTGADQMFGGHGNDTYVVDDVNDVVSEFGADAQVIHIPFGHNINIPGDMGGIDTIETTLGTFSLSDTSSKSTLAWIENLTYTGTGDFVGTGNALANQIMGGNGNDHLFGGAGADDLWGGNGNDVLDGGTGDDRMHGGAGNDVYIVDSVNDQVVESSLRFDPVTHHLMPRDSGGIDEIRTSLSSYSLANNSHISGNVENLSFSGSGNFEGHGNALDNVITGGAGNDRLFGNAGNDTLFGGAGNDSLFGGSGKDILVGGTGADRLTGGSGADKFVFALGDNGVTAKTADHITDFGKGDQLDVSDFVASHHTIEATKNFGGDIGKALDFANKELAAGHNEAGSAILADSSSHNVYVFMDQDGDHKFESAVVLDHADSHMSDIHAEVAQHQLFV